MPLKGVFAENRGIINQIRAHDTNYIASKTTNHLSMQKPIQILKENETQLQFH